MCKRIYILINIIILLLLISNFYLACQIFETMRKIATVYFSKKKKKTSDKEMAFSGNVPWSAGVRPRGIEQKKHELLPL